MAELIKKCCMTCSGYDEETCISHSLGYEAHISHPSTFVCKDYDPVASTKQELLEYWNNPEMVEEYIEKN